MRFREWSRRPSEEANLFNPALMAVTLVRAAEAYRAASGFGLPLELAFLVPPVVMAKSIRDLLPRQSRTSLPAWLEENPAVRMRFADAAASMAQLVREGLLFGYCHGALTIEDSQITAQKLSRSATAIQKASSSEVQEILSRAAFVGKWYALAGKSDTVMALWGVRP